MAGWELVGTIAAVWFAASFVIALRCALFGRIRKPAPQPELSDQAVNAIFDLMVQDMARHDGAES
jgi:hypothetical protein